MEIRVENATMAEGEENAKGPDRNWEMKHLNIPHNTLDYQNIQRRYRHVGTQKRMMVNATYKSVQGESHTVQKMYGKSVVWRCRLLPHRNNFFLHFIPGNCNKTEMYSKFLW